MGVWSSAYILIVEVLGMVDCTSIPRVAGACANTSLADVGTWLVSVRASAGLRSQNNESASANSRLFLHYQIVVIMLVSF